MIITSRSHNLSLPELRGALFYIIELQKIQDTEIEQAKAYLDSATLDRAQKFIFDEDRKRRLLVHAILRFHLEKLIKQKASSIKILRDGIGKPYLEGHPIHFNLSYSDQYAFLAFHPHSPIGVDIERIQDGLPFLRIADLFMHPSEKRQMNENKNPRDYFFTLWCAKEALLKAKGLNFDGLRYLQLENASSSHDVEHFFSMDFEVYVYKNRVMSHRMATCHAL